jgi:hypothetical protein
MSSSSFPKLELKYCERCGGLWFRPQGGQEVYCAKCANAIRELPAVKLKSSAAGGGAETMGGGWA